jgi:hypothetical protein
MHPKSWTPAEHYGQCGQSCPCCRARVEETSFGVCLVCRAGGECAPNSKKRRRDSEPTSAAKRQRPAEPRGAGHEGAP